MLKITPSTQQYLRHCYFPLIDPFSFFQGNFISPSTSGKVSLLLTYLCIRSGFQEIQILSLHNKNFHLKSASYQLSDYEKCPDCPFPSQNFGDSSLIDFFSILSTVYQQNRQQKKEVSTKLKIFMAIHAVPDPKGYSSLWMQQMEQSPLTDLRRKSAELFMNLAGT